MLDWIVGRLHSTRGARYAVSIVALIVAAVLTALIIHFKLPRQLTGYGFLLVIVGSAWWGGYGPGLFTTSATLLLGPYLTQPTYSIHHPNLNSAPMVILISVLISRMAGARQKLREANEKLDMRVRERTTELETVNGFLREREAQLMAQAERLSESNTDLEQFAYFASHDLQEHLRMIAIYAELLQENDRFKVDEESSRCVRVVRDSVRRLEVLVDDLLKYSRAIHDELANVSEVDPNEAVLIATTNLESQIEKEGATVTSIQLPKLVANPGHLIQVFQNLIGNGLKYRGQDPPRIAISATKSEEEWIFSIKDNGIGIAPDYHEKIFIPFKRLHGQQYPGSGVGLAICRRIVERHGGRIWVESEPGRGAAFYFSVPTTAARESIEQRSEVTMES